MRFHFLVLMIGTSLLLPAAALSKSYQARRFDVTLRLQPDGTLLVAETVEFSFSGGPFTYVYRDLDAARTDGIDQVRAEPGRVEVKGTSPIRVRWHFPEIRDQARRFTLNYRVQGAIRKTPGGDALYWMAIPRKRRYGIGGSRILLEFPGGAAPLEPPVIEGRGNAAREAGADWVRFSIPEVRRNRGVALRAVFPAGSLIQAPPRWQHREAERSARIREAVPAGALAGAAVLLLALGLILYARLGESGPEDRSGGDLRVTHPPSAMPPAMAAQLAGGQTAFMVALAALFDLARRGVLRFIQGEPRRLRRTPFHIERAPADTPLAPHERALLAILFEHGGESGSRVTVAQAGRAVLRRGAPFHRALTEELLAPGLVEPRRQRLRRRLFAAAALLTAGGGLLAGAALLWGSTVSVPEDLRLAAIFTGIGAGLAAAGLGALAAASTLSPLTAQGALQAGMWRGFRSHLKDVARGREPAGAEVLDPYLPYAAGFGFASRWTRHFEKRGIAEAPPWLIGMHGQTAHIGALMAVITGAGGGHGRGGGGGASGGGASGAG